MRFLILHALFSITVLCVGSVSSASESPGGQIEKADVQTQDFVHESELQAKKLGQAFARGFYEKRPDLSLSTLHPALSKLGVIPNIRKSGQSAILRLTPGTLDAFAKSHNADGHIDPAEAKTEITIMDSADDVAVFRLVADKDWFDYYIAVKIGDRWQLVNCVFGGYSQLHGERSSGDRASILLASRQYADKLAAGNGAGVTKTVYPDFERRSVVQHGRSSWLQTETLETLQMDATKFTTPKMPKTKFLGSTQITGAVRIDAEHHIEWLFLLKMDGKWRIVNSFWKNR